MGRWVPLKRRPPEEDGVYIVCIVLQINGKKEKKVIPDVKYENGKFHCRNEVTHWMPYPDPPADPPERTEYEKRVKAKNKYNKYHSDPDFRRRQLENSRRYYAEHKDQYAARYQRKKQEEKEALKREEEEFERWKKL